MAYKTCPDCGSRMFEHGCVNCNEHDYISMQDEYVPPPLTKKVAPQEQELVFKISNNGLVDKYLNEKKAIYHDNSYTIELEKFAEWITEKQGKEEKVEGEDVWYSARMLLYENTRIPPVHVIGAINFLKKQFSISKIKE